MSLLLKLSQTSFQRQQSASAFSVSKSDIDPEYSGQIHPEPT
jgi:hypothetical protein